MEPVLCPSRWKFLPTPSARRATAGTVHHDVAKTISIHALREEGDTTGYINYDGNYGISIHALREEGDVMDMELVACGKYFYPRPPRGGRPVSSRKYPGVPKFLSTPSARRATCASMG